MHFNRLVAVLDTCVLAPMPVADTILRLGEEPYSYLPRWSEHILTELYRTLLKTFRYSREQADRRIRVIREHFPESLVTDYEHLIPSMKNDPRDARVLAAAVRCSATLIAGQFLERQYRFDNNASISLLGAQAADIGKPLDWLLHRLPRNLTDLIKG